MKYGDLPASLGIHLVDCKEMMFYQYLPIKMIGSSEIKSEERLHPFDELVGACCCDFIGQFGLNAFVNNYIYLTAKHLFQAHGCSFNRPGYHSDGFLTDDINYIWCNKNPTVFNTSNYALTMHHEYSLDEMALQSLVEKEVTYQKNELLRLNQFNIHKVADVPNAGLRTFFKLSFSKEKYNLVGNSINLLFNYNWEMKEREAKRNHPVK